MNSFLLFGKRRMRTDRTFPWVLKKVSSSVCVIVRGKPFCCLAASRRWAWPGLGG